MHREILNTPLGAETDHLNGDGLDNRKSNLRAASKSQNAGNARAHRNSSRTSKFKGVTFERSTGRWVARIRRQGRMMTVGRFDDENDAASAYADAARRVFGAFAFEVVS